MLNFVYFVDKKTHFIECNGNFLLFLDQLKVKYGELFNRFGNVPRADVVLQNLFCSFDPRIKSQNVPRINQHS